MTAPTASAAKPGHEVLRQPRVFSQVRRRAEIGSINKLERVRCSRSRLKIREASRARQRARKQPDDTVANQPSTRNLSFPDHSRVVRHPRKMSAAITHLTTTAVSPPAM